jgi:general secretion pathway protein C
MMLGYRLSEDSTPTGPTMQTFPLRNPGMEAILRRWSHALQHSGPTLVTVVLILILAWILADLTWSFIPQKPQAASPAAAPMQTAVRQVDASQVAQKHIFGTSSAPAGNLNNAPDTTLALTLHGIVAGRRASDSRALIVANGDEAPYAIGAQLPGGAVIRAIYPDRVLLERDGRVEALRLPKPGDSSGGGVSPVPGVAMQRAQPYAQPQNLGQLRQEIANNPQRLMDVVRAMPVMDHGKLAGYRIYPAGNPSAFNQLGLKPGDVVTGVNGIPLTDPAQSMRVLSSLKTSEQVSITLTRNGQSQTQVLQMGPPELGQSRQQQQDQQDGDEQDDSDNPP